MIVASPHPTELFSLNASIGGIAVYLDHFAIKELAKGDPVRRKRFVDSLDRGVEVLFSVANAAELSGPQGESFEKMRAFLDEIGPHWFPIEWDPRVIVSNEAKGSDPSKCCFDEELLKVFTATRINRHSAAGVLSMSADFFRLGLFMECLGPQREAIARRKTELDTNLINQIGEYRVRHEADPEWLDVTFPELRSFRPDQPATFAYVNLIRNLILDAKGYRLMPGDGIDFCQAVIATAYSSVVTLDKHWMRRIECLPKPNKLAVVYRSPNLDKLVNDIERSVQKAERRVGNAN